MNKYNVSEAYDPTLDSDNEDGYDSDHEMPSHDYIMEMSNQSAGENLPNLSIVPVILSVLFDEIVREQQEAQQPVQQVAN